MKKLIIAVAAIAVAVIGFGALGSTVTQANPTTVIVINNNVANALTQSTANFSTAAGRAAVAAKVPLATLATDSANQVSSDVAGTGGVTIIVSSDDPATTMVLNGKGLTCAPACDNVATQTPDPTDRMAAWTVTNAGSFATGSAVTATQDSVQVSSSALTLVGAAHDMQITATKATVQEGATTCTSTADQTAPTNGAAVAIYTDLNGNQLVGYRPLFATSAVANLALGNPATTAGISSLLSISMLQADGKTIAGADSYCGIAANAGVTLSATSSNNSAGAEVPGATQACTATTSPPAFPATIAGNVCLTRTTTVVVTGVPAAIALTASPAAIPCDGTSTSTVTAKVTDSAGNNVVDNTPVTFSVVALGTANPINTKTTGGSATSTITPLSGGTAGVVVQVTAGSAASSVRIDCLPSLATATAAAAGGATATPRTGITGPNTGTGGYLGNSSSSGFPMWTLIALALGSFVLVGGGIVARRAK